MVDKAFLVGVDDLQELCEELKNYSLSAKRGEKSKANSKKPT